MWCWLVHRFTGHILGNAGALLATPACSSSLRGTKATCLQCRIRWVAISLWLCELKLAEILTTSFPVAMFQQYMKIVLYNFTWSLMEETLLRWILTVFVEHGPDLTYPCASTCIFNHIHRCKQHPYPCPTPDCIQPSVTATGNEVKYWDAVVKLIRCPLRPPAYCYTVMLLNTARNVPMTELQFTCPSCINTFMYLSPTWRHNSNWGVPFTLCCITMQQTVRDVWYATIPPGHFEINQYLPVVMCKFVHYTCNLKQKHMHTFVNIVCLLKWHLEVTTVHLRWITDLWTAKQTFQGQRRHLGWPAWKQFPTKTLKLSSVFMKKYFIRLWTCNFNYFVCKVWNICIHQLHLPRVWLHRLPQTD